MNKQQPAAQKRATQGTRELKSQPTAQPASASPQDPSPQPDPESVSVATVAQSTQALPHRTDVGNAEMFARLNRDNLRFDHHRQRWLSWRGHWWAEDTDGRVFRIAKSVVRCRREIALRTAVGDDLEAEKKWAMRSEARTRLEAMLALARSEGYLADAGQEWDTDPWLLGVANGVVDLRSGQLRPGRQKDQITMHIAVPFEPGAGAPRWGQ